LLQFRGERKGVVERCIGGKEKRRGCPHLISFVVAAAAVILHRRCCRCCPSPFSAAADAVTPVLVVGGKW
jgi:hypothetical protein